jgi:hypothetical protein
MPPPDPPAGRRRLTRADRKEATSARALRALDEWMAAPGALSGARP